MIRGMYRKLCLRSLSTSASLYSAKQPRFAQTLQETGKPALTKPQEIRKPIGLDAPSTLNAEAETKGRSLAGSIRSFFSEDSIEKRRDSINYDITHSPFYESKSFANTKGKIFTPPVSYFKAEKSKFFPDFLAKCLAGEERYLHEMTKNKVSVIRLFSTVSGEKCTETYFENEGKNYLSNGHSIFLNEFPLSEIIDINVPIGWLKSKLVKWSLGNLKKIVPKERQQNYLILSEKSLPFDVKQKLMCDNRCSGYIYVVDYKGRIRWATSGYANEEERKLLWKCVSSLEKELTSLKS